jgi:hypothetical protein
MSSSSIRAARGFVVLVRARRLVGMTSARCTAALQEAQVSDAARSRDYVVLTVGHYVACIVAAFIGGVLVSLLTFGPLS